PSLVLQEGTQLGERPIAQAPPLTVAKPWLTALANPGQFLDCDTALALECLGDDLFGEDVVGVPLETRLSSGQLAQAPPCRATVTALVRLAGATGSPPDLFDLPAGVTGAVTVHGDVDDAEVYTEKVLDCQGRRLGQVHRGQEVKLALPMHEVALPLEAVEPLPLIFPVDQPD